MRRIYLVRHGTPDTGTSERICLGRKDIPLAQKGKEEIRRLAEYFCREEITENLTMLFSSPLKRCMETAGILCDAMNLTSEIGETIPEKRKQDSAVKKQDRAVRKQNHAFFTISEVEDFQEVDTGIWDGLTFKEIKERFPEEYEERGKSLGRYRIPGGETLEETGNRFLLAIKKCMVNTEGDLLVVSHTGVIRAFLCLITGRDIDQINDWTIPYGSVTEVLWEVDAEQGGDIQGNNDIRWTDDIHGTDDIHETDDIHWTIAETGLLPVETLTMQDVEAIWKNAGTTEDQKAHMRTTAEYAIEIAEQVPTVSERDKKILCYSALLHDMFRSMGRGHEEAGADWLMKKGYNELAEPVRMHNDAKVVHSGDPLTIAEILYYADKRCRGSQIVTIQERFDSSRKKIRDEEGRKKHRERMEAAFAIEKKLKMK